MRTASKLALGLALIAGASALSAAPATRAQAYIASYAGRSDIPVPVKVVSPTAVSAEYAGLKVDVTFTVDAQGLPTDIQVADTADSALARSLVSAIEQWRFNPAQRDGQPIASKVKLPVVLTEEQAGHLLAMN